MINKEYTDEVTPDVPFPIEIDEFSPASPVTSPVMGPPVDDAPPVEAPVAPVVEPPPPVPKAPPPPVVPEVVEDKGKNFQRIYGNLTSQQLDYYRDNPEQLEAELVYSRSYELQAANPKLTDDQALDAAIDEFERTTVPSDNIDPSAPSGPVVATPAIRHRGTSGWTDFAPKLVLTSARGLVAVPVGVAHAAAMIASAAARTLDWAVEFAGYEGFDDQNSMIYTYKNGISKSTREKIVSLGGLLPKQKGMGWAFQEDLITMVAGAKVISATMEYGMTTKLGVALSGSGVAGSVTSGYAKFAESSPKLAKYVKYGLDGAALDVSAALLIEPGSLVDLGAEGLEALGYDKGWAKDFHEWYTQSPELVKRGLSLGEGLFVNVALGIVGAAAGSLFSKLETPSVPGGAIDDAAGNTVPQLQEIYRELVAQGTATPRQLDDIRKIIEADSGTVIPVLTSVTRGPAVRKEGLKFLQPNKRKALDNWATSGVAPDSKLLKGIKQDMRAYLKNKGVSWDKFLRETYGISDSPRVNFAADFGPPPSVVAQQTMEIPPITSADTGTVSEILARKAAQEVVADSGTMTKAQRQLALVKENLETKTLERMAANPGGIFPITSGNKRRAFKGIEAVLDLDTMKPHLGPDGTPFKFNSSQQKYVEAIEAVMKHHGVSGRMAFKYLANDSSMLTPGQWNTIAEAAKVATSDIADHAVYTGGVTDVVLGDSKNLVTMRAESEGLAGKLREIAKYLKKKKAYKIPENASFSSMSREEAQKLLDSVRPKASELKRGGTLMVHDSGIVRNLDNVTIVSSEQVGVLAKKVGLDNDPDFVEKISKSLRVAMRKDKRAAANRMGMFLLPENTMKWLAEQAKAPGLSALKIAGMWMRHTGMIGGAATAYLTGLDVDGNGTTDFYDVAAGALAYSVGGIIYARAMNKKGLLKKLSTDALVKALEKENQEIAGTYLFAKEMLNDGIAKVNPEHGKVFESIRDKLEDYLFADNKNVMKLVEDPTIRRYLDDVASVEYSPEGIASIKRNLQNKYYIDATSDLEISQFNFTNPATYEQEFDELVQQLAPVFRGADNVKVNSQVQRKLSEMATEFGISNETYRRMAAGAPEEVAAKLQSVRGMLASIDNEIQGLLKPKAIADDIAKDVDSYVLMARINQRRALGEFIRNGYAVGGHTFDQTLAMANKGALLSVMSDATLKNMKTTQGLKDTIEAVRHMHNTMPSFSGERLTALYDGLGRNLTAGELAVEAQYMSMLSSLRTMSTPWLENTASTFMAFLSEGASTLIGAATGTNTLKAMGKDGWLGGLFSSIGERTDMAVEMFKKSRLGFDVGNNKEFAVNHSMRHINKFFGTESPDVLNRGFSKFAEFMGIDPVAMSTIPDAFFKGILFDAYKAKYTVEEAFDIMARGRGKITYEEAMKVTTQDMELMDRVGVDALKKARDYTFTSALDENSMTKKLLDMRNHNSLTRLMFPIFQTPVVAARQFMRFVPGANFLIHEERQVLSMWWNSIGKNNLSNVQIRAIDNVAGRIVAGMSMGYALWNYLAGDGFEIVGSGQFDPSFQSKLEQGITPHSVYNRKTGETYDMGRWIQFKATLGLWADLRDKMANSQDSEANEEDAGFLTLGSYALYSVFKNTQPDQVSNIIRMLGASRSEKSIGALIENEGAGLIGRALPALMREIGNANDPHKRETANQLESAYSAFMSGMGNSETLRPQLDLYGEPKSREKKVTPDPLLEQIGETGYDVRHYLKERGRVGGLKVGDTPEEQNLAYASEKLHGQFVSANREKLYSQLRAEKVPDEKLRIIKRFFNEAHYSAKSQLRTNKETAALMDRLLDQSALRR